MNSPHKDQWRGALVFSLICTWAKQRRRWWFETRSIWRHCYEVNNIAGDTLTAQSARGPTTIRWRHNGHDDISNHQFHHCLLNRLFGCWSRKTSKLRVTGLCAGIHRGPVNSRHKWPVTRKMFPFDDVMMSICDSDRIIPEYSYPVKIPYGYAANLVARSRYYHCHWTLLMPTETDHLSDMWSYEGRVVKKTTQQNISCKAPLRISSWTCYNCLPDMFPITVTS